MATRPLALRPITAASTVEVTVFGPRRLEMALEVLDARAELEGGFTTEIDLDPPTVLPENLMRLGAFVEEEWFLRDGLPTVAVAQLVCAPEMDPGVLSDVDAYKTQVPGLTSIGEDVRFYPAQVVWQNNTSTYRRYPKAKPKARTTREVTSWPSTDGAVVIEGRLPGPRYVPVTPYWRGEDATTPTVEFRPTSTGVESLIASSSEWLTGPHFTVLMAILPTDTDQVYSPLLEAYTASPATPRLGIRFTEDLQFGLYEQNNTNPVTARSFISTIQVADDIRRSNQPFIIGLRINQTTKKAAMIACDTRIHMVRCNLKRTVPANAYLQFGGATERTGPGAFDILDMRWWRRDVDDNELELMTAIMADMWGVTEK